LRKPSKVQAKAVELLTKPDKRKPLWQYFSMAFFDDLVRPKLGTYAEYTESLPDKSTALHPLAWRNAFIKAEYEKAPPTTQAVVKVLKTLLEKSLSELPTVEELSTDEQFSRLPLESQVTVMDTVEKVLRKGFVGADADARMEEVAEEDEATTDRPTTSSTTSASGSHAHTNPVSQSAVNGEVPINKDSSDLGGSNDDRGETSVQEAGEEQRVELSNECNVATPDKALADVKAATLAAITAVKHSKVDSREA
jgi:hypothetical protein